MYNIDPSSITVSGFSAGGFMAAQLAIAYSSNLSGFGVFAGGPYDCARNQSWNTACMYNATPSIDLPIANIRQWSSEGKIDDIDNLRSHRIFIHTGVQDDVIGLATTAQLVKQVETFVPEDHVHFVTLESAVHAFPTDFDSPGAIKSQCSELPSQSPFIANCAYDGAGQMLQWLYNNTLQPRKSIGDFTGTIRQYAQTGYMRSSISSSSSSSSSWGAIGLAEYGYYYEPAKCGANENNHNLISSPTTGECKLHIALHGCTMSHEDIGDAFIKHAGYLEWADANDMMVVFPQAGHDASLRPIWNATEEFAGGAIACFDWIGWSGEDADWRNGEQMRAIMNVVEWIVTPVERARFAHHTSQELE